MFRKALNYSWKLILFFFGSKKRFLITFLIANGVSYLININIYNDYVNTVHGVGTGLIHQGKAQYYPISLEIIETDNQAPLLHIGSIRSSTTIVSLLPKWHICSIKLSENLFFKSKRQEILNPHLSCKEYSEGEWKSENRSSKLLKMKYQKRKVSSKHPSGEDISVEIVSNNSAQDKKIKLSLFKGIQKIKEIMYICNQNNMTCFDASKPNIAGYPLVFISPILDLGSLIIAYLTMAWLSIVVATISILGGKFSLVGM